MSPTRGPHRVLHVLVTLQATNGQYHEHCLPLAAERSITVCSLRPAQLVPPPAIGLVDGDGSVRGALDALDRALAAGPYDVVHAHAPASAFLLVLANARRGHGMSRCVFTLQNSWTNYPHRNRALLYAVFAAYPEIVLCSHAVLYSLPAPLRHLGRRKTTVVPNGVDLSHVDHALASADATADPPAQPFTVVSVGRLVEIKNTPTLLRAFHAGAGADGRLVVVGEGHLRPQLAETARTLGLGDRVVFAGLLGRDEVYRSVAAGDVYVSTSYGEGLPVAVLEAMACGSPVVLSDIPPHREIARHDPGAVPLVDADDADGFAREIARVREMSPGQRRALGERCRRVVERGYGTQAMHEALTDVYARAMRAEHEVTEGRRS